jgi:hypothetical protein
MTKSTVFSYFFIFMSVIISPSSTASLFDDFTSGEFKSMFKKIEIGRWSKANKANVKISRARFVCPFDPCVMTGKLTNNTDEFLSQIVVEFKIYNKLTKKLVIKSRELLSISIMPTVSKSFRIGVNNALLAVAYEQLGDNYSSNYELIGVIPEEMRITYSRRDEEFSWLD